MRRCLSLPKDSLQIFPELAQLNEIILERFSGDGVAVVAHLLRAGLRASGLLEMSAKEDLVSINRYCSDAILDLARARLQYKAAHGKPAYREWMKPTSAEKRRVPAVPEKTTSNAVSQVSAGATGHPDVSSQSRVISAEDFASSHVRAPLTEALQLSEPAHQVASDTKLVNEELNQDMNLGAGAGPDLLAQFRGNPLF